MYKCELIFNSYFSFRRLMITPRSIESGNLLFLKAFSPAYLNAAVKIFIAIEN